MSYSTGYAKSPSGPQPISWQPPTPGFAFSCGTGRHSTPPSLTYCTHGTTPSLSVSARPASSCGVGSMASQSLNPGALATEALQRRYATLCWCARQTKGTTPSVTPRLKVLQAESPADLRRCLERFSELNLTPVVTESLLTQRVLQYSIPVARGHGRMMSFVASKVRPTPDMCDVGSYVELSPAPVVEELACRVMDELDYFGIGEVEILHSADTERSYLIEVNARPWLQYSLAPASGHDLLGLVLGDEVRPAPALRKQGLRWIYFRSDLTVCFSRRHGLVWRGRLGLVDYLRSLVRANVWAIFSFRDPRPWFAEVVGTVEDLLRSARIG